MDYDENDFQSQNFQLGGDENKFPPTLRSFSLPKFDLDEHLQVHLRFDSLVDTTDVLLGIRNQDSNWIEDFSSGTSAIEFSSSAPDNCSISRHTNVWSEATSSESVEMLLKSVGEDDMNDRKDTAMEDAQNLLSDMINQVDPASRQAGNANSMMGDVIHEDQSVPPDKNILGKDKDPSGFLSEVHVMPQIFNNEISSAELDASSVGDEIQSDQKIGAGRCISDETSTLNLGVTNKKYSVTSETLCKIVNNDESLTVHSVEGSDGHCWDISEVTRGCPDPIACVSTQAQVVDEQTVINTIDRSLLNDAQKDRSQILRHVDRSDQFVEGHEVETHLCTTGRSSFSEPGRDTLVLMHEGCNMTGFSGNPDGLLEAIAYQVKPPKSGNKAGGKSSMQELEMNTLEIENEKFVQTQQIDVDKENIHDLLIGPNVGITNAEEVEVNASIHVNFQLQLKEKEVKKCLDVNSPNQGYHNPDGAFKQKNVEAEAVKDVEESGSNLSFSENVTLGGSTLHAVLDNVEVKMLPPVPDKLPEAAEPVDTSFLDVSAEEKGTGPFTTLATTNFNDDASAAKWEVGEARSAGHNSDNLRETILSSTKKVADDQSVGDLASMGFGLPCIKKYTCEDVSHPSGSLLRDVARDHLEVTSPKSLESESIYCDVKEVKTTGISSVSGLKSKLDAQLLIEPVMESDPVGPPCSSPRKLDHDIPVGEKVLDEAVKSDQSDVSSAAAVPEQLESMMSSQFSLQFVQPDGKEKLISPKGDVDNRPIAESDFSENNPLSCTTKPQASLVDQRSTYVENSITNECKSQFLTDKPVTCEEAIATEENLVIHGSFVKRKNNSCKSEASSHEKDESTLSIYASPVDSDLSASTTLTKSNAEVHFSVVKTPEPSLPEPSHDSPAVISYETEGGNDDSIKQATRGSNDGTASKDETSFTFEVGKVEELCVKDAGQWKPFPSSKSSSVHPKITEESPGCHSESGRKRHGVKQISCEDKSQMARSSHEKLTTPRSKSAKGTSKRKKSTDTIGKSCTTSSASIGTVSSGMQSEEIKLNPCSESNHAKSPGSAVQSSSLPDLNSSSITFHQPFTDIQQVQLRAQIFVYGSLIQSIPPDEACMQSAFGETDGGRSSWESLWHKSVERYQNQKTPINVETPLTSHSVARVPEQVTKCSSLQSKAVNTSAGRSVGKVIPPATLNTTPPLPSPLWSISTHDGLHPNFPRGAQLDFNQAFSPLHSYPSSQARQFASGTSPWLPHNPRPAPWAVSTQSPTINASTHYSTVPVIETVQVPPVRECPASLQLASSSHLLPSPTPASVPPPSIMHLETPMKAASPVNKSISTSRKSRNRKKTAMSEDFAETIPVSQSPAEAAFVAALTEPLPSASLGMPLSANTPLKVVPEPIISTRTHFSSTPYQTIGIGNTEQRVIFSEETCNKIDQAKLHAENAAALAASVVSHSQSIWNQLAAQRNSGLVTEVEEKLASAAVAAAAAASVAKVAAAAAKIASDAAVQAKMMADEALDSVKTGTVTRIADAAFGAGTNLTRLTPGSILKGKDKIHGSNLIISATREAARKRVETASAATKRAENLDAIMKAAELAAEAVSQVGTIIAMGDPLPIKLSELVEAGPDGSWRTYRSTSEKLNKANNEKDLDHNGHQYDQTPINNKEMRRTATEDGIVHDEKRIQSGNNCQGLGAEAGNPSTLINASQTRDQPLSNLNENAIQKGSIVEVISDEDGLRGGWFSARVLDVKDNKAHVCYNNLLSDDGSGQLKEWVSLGCEINGAPRIRIAHPLLGMKHDGTRKRRRDAISSHAWEVGDRVDAWMRDGWWEGIVTGKSQVDEMKLTVHFPAGGDTSLVQTWDLRPSLTWKDGQWIEWSRARENVVPYEGDTPQEKRQKLGRSEERIDVEVDGRGVSKLSKKMPPEISGQAGELGLLNLSAKDKLFSIGKNASEANISDPLKVKRTGLQKEGSRVVFGVPKPGKKRKFMEVSKHYVSDKTATSQGNDPLKFAKYLMPQASRPWRNTSKIDPKGKQPGESKSLGIKSVKSRTSQNKNIAEKDSLSVTVVSTSNVEKNGHGSSSNLRAGISNEENHSEKNSLDVVSFPRRLGTTESLSAVSSVQSQSSIPASKKKTSSTVEAELGVKGRVTPAVDKSTRSEKKPLENTGKTDSVEPRRSNRKIQPTSRLLEGLQSSLIISKIPTFSHDKGSKALHRSSSSRGNTRG